MKFRPVELSCFMRAGGWAGGREGDGQADTKKLILTFHNLSKARKKERQKK